jgi:ribosomal protein L10
MPIKIAVPAGITLMAHQMDYLEKTANLKVTQDLLAQCTQTTMQFILQRFGISKDKLASAVQQAQSLKQNPQVASPIKGA